MFSVLPLTTDIAQHRRHVGKVPRRDIARAWLKTKVSDPVASWAFTPWQAVDFIGFGKSRLMMRKHAIGQMPAPKYVLSVCRQSNREFASMPPFSSAYGDSRSRQSRS